MRGPVDRAYEYVKDPIYYAMVAIMWIGVIGALVGVWALTPWFPWK